MTKTSTRRPAQKSFPEISTPSRKPPLILVHGYRGSPLGLAEIANDLRASGYEVHTPPIPPFAGGRALSDYTPKEYNRYLADYIREYSLARPILIGHSMGSVVVSSFAKSHPELINSKLVLLSPIAERTPKPFAMLASLAASFPRPLVDFVTTKYLFVPKDKRLFKHTLELTHQCSEDQPPKGSALRAAGKFSTDYSIRDFMPNRNILIIAGEKDRLVPKKQTEKLAKDLDAKTSFIPNSGHLHNYTKPHETAQIILDFLKDQ